MPTAVGSASAASSAEDLHLGAMAGSVLLRQYKLLRCLTRCACAAARKLLVP